MTPTLWLSCHVDYACRHSGVCCRAGWPLPVEAHVVPVVAAAISAGRLTTTDGARAWLIESPEAPEGLAGTLRQAKGACVFHHRRVGGTPEGVSASASSPRHCAVHAHLGPEALPSTCRHFPRLCLVDDRGARVSLSHACPTAAAMLVDHAGPVEIVHGGPAVPGLAVPEGLDVRGALPPLLTQRVLMDLEALTAWEAHVVDVLTGPATWSAPVDRAFVALAGAVDCLERWRPSDRPLAECVRLLGGADGESASDTTTTASVREASRAWALAASACHSPWTPEPLPETIDEADARWVAPAWDDVAPVVRRYLAARAFGAWIVWQADAVCGLVAWLAIARDVLRTECARATTEARGPLDRTRLIEALGRTDRLLGALRRRRPPRRAFVTRPTPRAPPYGQRARLRVSEAGPHANWRP